MLRFFIIASLLLLALSWLFRTKKLSKGDAGERRVQHWLATLPHKTYHSLHNITLPTADGTTQIDHLIVSRYGIFVIETKNMQGWLFADAKQKSWTQQLGEHRYPFQNPLHQNYKHTQTVKTLLGCEDSYVFSLVVFVGNAQFKTPLPYAVVQGKSQLLAAIKAQKTALVTDHELQTYTQKIKTAHLKPNRKTAQRHIAHVQQIVQAKQQPPIHAPAEKICPKCGKPLTLRTAQHGQHQGKTFWGCTGFPACRFIE